MAGLSRYRGSWGQRAGRFAGLALLVSLGAVICAAQAQGPKSETKNTPAPTKSEVEKSPSAINQKATFAGLMRASTEAEGRRAADEALAKKSGKKLESKAPKSDEVLEFQRVSPSSEPAFVDRKQKKGGALKDIHGEVYGMGGGLGSVEGGNVGATAKGGKLDIFLEASHAKSSSAPHR